MLGIGLVRAGNADHLDLVELMLADVATRVAPRRSGFGTEAGGQRGQADRQLGFGEDLLAHRIGQAHFGGGDQPSAIGGLEQVFAEFGQLCGAIGGIVAHQQRRGAFGIARCPGLHVEHERAERPLQPRHLPAQESETRAGHFRGGLEIEAKAGTEIGMFLGGEVETARGAPAFEFDIAGFVGAFWDVGGGEVGDGRQKRGQIFKLSDFRLCGAKLLGDIH